MKNCVILGLVLCLTGCYVPTLDTIYSRTFHNIPLYYADYSKVKGIWDIPTYYTTISYKPTSGVQTPQETMERGTGDCDCFTLLYMNIAYCRFGLKCNLVLTDPQRTVVAGGKVNHTVVQLPSGLLIEAETGSIYHGTISYIYSFDEVFQ